MKCRILVLFLLFSSMHTEIFGWRQKKNKVNIQKVMDYPIPRVLARYQKDYHVSVNMAKEHERELKRYLILAALDNEPLDMFSDEVDNLWHTFLLFTKDYLSFCNKMFGKFMHHEPIDQEKNQENKINI